MQHKAAAGHASRQLLARLGGPAVELAPVARRRRLRQLRQRLRRLRRLRRRLRQRLRQRRARGQHRSRHGGRRRRGCSRHPPHLAADVRRRWMLMDGGGGGSLDDTLIVHHFGTPRAAATGPRWRWHGHSRSHRRCGRVLALDRARGWGGKVEGDVRGCGDRHAPPSHNASFGAVEVQQRVCLHAAHPVQQQPPRGLCIKLEAAAAALQGCSDGVRDAARVE
jgi:hypothetical protein